MRWPSQQPTRPASTRCACGASSRT